MTNLSFLVFVSGHLYLFLKPVNFDPATVRELLRIALFVKLAQLGKYLGKKEKLSHN